MSSFSIRFLFFSFPDSTKPQDQSFGRRFLSISPKMRREERRGGGQTDLEEGGGIVDVKGGDGMRREIADLRGSNDRRDVMKERKRLVVVFGSCGEETGAIVEDDETFSGEGMKGTILSNDQMSFSCFEKTQIPQREGDFVMNGMLRHFGRQEHEIIQSL